MNIHVYIDNEKSLIAYVEGISSLEIRARDYALRSDAFAYVLGLLGQQIDAVNASVTPKVIDRKAVL